MFTTRSSFVEPTTTDTATLQPTSATVKHFGELIPVTLEPGASAILPLYGERLAKAIRIGSRVVRGRDWVWGYQVGLCPQKTVTCHLILIISQRVQGV